MNPQSFEITEILKHDMIHTYNGLYLLKDEKKIIFVSQLFSCLLYCHIVYHFSALKFML